MSYGELMNPLQYELGKYAGCGQNYLPQLGLHGQLSQWQENQLLAGLGLQYGAVIPARKSLSQEAIAVYRRARKWRRVLRVIHWMVNL